MQIKGLKVEKLKSQNIENREGRAGINRFKASKQEISQMPGLQINREKNLNETLP